MKNLIKLIIFVPILLFESSCSYLFDRPNHRTAYLVEGEFVGFEWIDSDTKIKDKAKLTVKRIDYDSYLNANGVDVVVDINGGDNPYFNLDFRVFDEESQTFKALHFCSLNERYDPHVVYYCDDNLNLFYTFLGAAVEYEHSYLIDWNEKETDETSTYHHYWFDKELVED